MSWKATSATLYERPLGRTEVAMSAILAGTGPPAREFILINCVVRFSASHSHDEVIIAVKLAWKALRLLTSPDIATTFGDGKKYYKVPSSSELENWLDDTFVVAETDSSVNQAVRDRQARPTYLPTCTLVPNSNRGTGFDGSIVLFISHWRTEAAGVLKMINQILDFADDILNGGSTAEILDNHRLGDETALLTPTLDEILMAESTPSSEAISRVAQDFADYYSKFPPLDFPMQGEISAKPSFLKVDQRTYTSQSTSTLVNACKGQNISVTSAVHAAYLGSVWSVANNASKNLSYVSMMPAQVRTRLPPSSRYREQGCWDSARMLLLTAPPDQMFLDRSRHLMKQYSRAASDTWLYDDIRQIPLEMARPPPANVQPMPASMPWFTSIGVLDREVIMPYHGSIKIDDITFWADSAAPGIVLRLWTFAGRLSIHIQWNTAFHSDEIIRDTLDTIETILNDELKIELTIEKRSVEEYNE